MKPVKRMINIRLDGEVFYKLKSESIRTTMSKTVEDLMDSYISKEKKLTKPLKSGPKQSTLNITESKFEAFKKLVEEAGMSMEAAIQQMIEDKFFSQPTLPQPPHSEE
jgi:predicted DNA binding CopG/RHH family protein